MGLLEKLTVLTDDQLIEVAERLEDAETDDLRLVVEAAAMEYERRHGEGSLEAMFKGDDE